MLSPSYYIKEKTSTEASYTKYKHAREDIFLQSFLSKVCGVFIFRQGVLLSV